MKPEVFSVLRLITSSNRMDSSMDELFIVELLEDVVRIDEAVWRGAATAVMDGGSHQNYGTCAMFR
jgi:hypothetical protein